jgi:hypothetical protein
MEPWEAHNGAVMAYAVAMKANIHFCGAGAARRKRFGRSRSCNEASAPTAASTFNHNLTGQLNTVPLLLRLFLL